MDRPASYHHSNQQFSGLEPHIQYVSRAAIKKKWKRLRPAAEDNVRDILSSLKLQSKVTKSRRITAKPDTQDCIDEVVERLISRLPRMPFPPSTNDENFNFELMLHRVQSIEEHLTSNIHGVNLLRQQIKIEERRLREDQQEVDLLENNLKMNNTVRSQQSKTFHPLVQQVYGQPYLATDKSPKSEALSAAHRPDLTDLEQDADAAPLLSQVRSHLDSMQNNRSSMHAVALAIENASYALLDKNTMNHVKT